MIPGAGVAVFAPFLPVMALIVQKYGGTSVGTPERILNCARRILETQQAGHQVIAVVLEDR